MISTSIPALVLSDLIVIFLAAVAVFFSISFGAAGKGRAPRAGRHLLTTGIAAAGIFCLLDLLLLILAPDLAAGQQPVPGTGLAQHDLRWIGTRFSLLLIASGFIVVVFQRRLLDEQISRTESAALDARDNAARTRDRFDAMLRQATDSIYCFEFVPPIAIDLPVEEQVARSLDAVLVECNVPFAKSIGKNSREEAKGVRLREMRSIMTPAAHARFHQRFIENGYWISDYKFAYEDPQGDQKLLLINATGDVEDGKLVRLWGSDKNILEQSQIQDTLEERLKFQEFVSRISSRLLLAQADNIEDALRRCLRDISEFLKIDRIAVVWLHQETNSVDLLYFWNETGAMPWDKLPLDEFPVTASRLLRGVPVIVNSVNEVSEDFEVDVEQMKKLGIVALAAMPLIVAGEIFGVLTFSDVHKKRIWNNYNLGDLQSLANLIANVVFRINSQKVLNDALVELSAMKDRLEAENIYLRQEIIQDNGSDELIGQSDNLRYCLHQVQQVAATDTAVLVQGETGTGKELIVRAIHELSDRSDRTLVKVNCAALPGDLIETELFGHEKGAFTGASSRKRGRFDLADGGTIFLDEIGDFPLDLQGKLLRVLQEGEFQRVGGTKTIKVDVRLIAATNRELEIAVDSGQFRADLYYRISVYPVNLPPLRERAGDVALLAEHFVHKYAPRLGKNVTAISASMMDQLQAYSWPGNVRELESVIQRALISGSGPILQLSEVLGQKTPSPGVSDNGLQPVDLLAAEKIHIERVLDQAGWVVAGGTGAAVKLGVPPSTLRSKMKKLGIRRP